MLSASMRRCADDFARQALVTLEGRRIELPERFAPDAGLLARHRAEVFLDAR